MIISQTMKVHRTIGQRIDGRAIWVNIFYHVVRLPSFRFDVARCTVVLPRTSRGRPDFFLPVRSQFSRDCDSEESESIWKNLDKDFEINGNIDYNSRAGQF